METESHSAAAPSPLGVSPPLPVASSSLLSSPHAAAIISSAARTAVTRQSGFSRRIVILAFPPWLRCMCRATQRHSDLLLELRRPVTDSRGEAVEVDGDDHDGQSTFGAEADVEPGDAPEHDGAD